MEAMNGLNEYDYGARRRETGIPVWTTPDPLCEMDYSISPYAYCMDNPINKTDPNGMACYGLGDNGKGDDDPLKRTHLDLHPPFGSTSQPWNDDKSIPEDVQDILDKINRSGKDDDFSHQPSYWYWAGNDKGRGKEKGNTKDKKTDKSKDQYGEIVAYVCISAGAAFGGGGSFEFGYVITNKNYAQYYITLSGMVGLATSVQAALGNIIPIKGKPIKLSDWMGSSTSVGVSTPFVGGQVGLNDNYSSPAVTVGLGVQYKAKLSGNLTTGKTMLIGSPVNPEQFSLDLTNPFNTSY
jgi:RHS repeat-associated protein